MNTLRISPNASPEELAPLAISIYRIIGHMPVVIRVKNQRGIVVEDCSVRDAVHESEALNEIFEGKHCACVKAEGGKYAGLPMFASAITDKLGRTIAAIGIIDTSGLLYMKAFMDISAHLDEQLNA